MPCLRHSCTPPPPSRSPGLCPAPPSAVHPCLKQCRDSFDGSWFLQQCPCPTDSLAMIARFNIGLLGPLRCQGQCGAAQQKFCCVAVSGFSCVVAVVLCSFCPGFFCSAGGQRPVSPRPVSDLCSPALSPAAAQQVARQFGPEGLRQPAEGPVQPRLGPTPRGSQAGTPGHQHQANCWLCSSAPPWQVEGSSPGSSVSLYT